MKVSTVGSFADYGDCSFPDFLILVYLAVIFSQVWNFFIPDALNLSEKLEPG